ncbi:MAG: hypothetical protein JSU72_11405 [Deltaproteobacteria bacterium]|nr:MAG: hypothetical protein JSU72_11405 [Deltaproteobacteria bacterium]
MSFKENLKKKIYLDELLQQLTSTMRDLPGQRRLDKELMRRLLDMTDFAQMKVRDLQLYVRPLKSELMEVLVFDNEVPIYHTTISDVALRKSPEWKEMFSIKNIKRILNDKDVVVSKGKESIKRIYASALELLDLIFTQEDLGLLVADARRGLAQKAVSQIQESLDLFFELLGFQPVSLVGIEDRFLFFAMTKRNGESTDRFAHLILFDEEKCLVSMRKGDFSPQSDSDLKWIERYFNGEETADFQGIQVFEFLAELALRKPQANEAYEHKD